MPFYLFASRPCLSSGAYCSVHRTFHDLHVAQQFVYLLLPHDFIDGWAFLPRSFLQPIAHMLLDQNTNLLRDVRPGRRCARRRWQITPSRQIPLPHADDVMAAVRAVDVITARMLTDHFHAITHAGSEIKAVRDMGLDALVDHGDRAWSGSRSPRQPCREATPRISRGLGISERGRGRHRCRATGVPEGHRYLVEAASSLRETHPRLLVLIAGRKGSSSSELERMVERDGLGDVVRFLGHRDDIPDLLAAADVFAFPSLYEGLGCAVIEAMAMEPPIVAFTSPRSGGRRGWAERRAVPAGATSALATELIVLTDERRRRELGVEAARSSRNGSPCEGVPTG